MGSTPRGSGADSRDGIILDINRRFQIKGGYKGNGEQGWQDSMSGGKKREKEKRINETSKTGKGGKKKMEI